MKFYIESDTRICYTLASPIVRDSYGNQTIDLDSHRYNGKLMITDIPQNETDRFIQMVYENIGIHRTVWVYGENTATNEFRIPGCVLFNGRRLNVKSLFTEELLEKFNGKTVIFDEYFDVFKEVS